MILGILGAVVVPGKSGPLFPLQGGEQLTSVNKADEEFQLTAGALLHGGHKTLYTLFATSGKVEPHHLEHAPTGRRIGCLAVDGPGPLQPVVLFDSAAVVAFVP